MTDQAGFRRYLEARQLTAAEVAANLSAVDDFALFLGSLTPSREPKTAEADEARAYVDRVQAGGRDTQAAVVALARYGAYSRNNSLFIAMLEQLDGAEVLENLRSRLGEVLGEAERDAVFAGITLPPLGADDKTRAEVMRAVIQRLLERIGEPATREVLSPCLRDLEPQLFAEDQARYEALGNLDAYLAWKHEQLIEELIRCRDQGRPYFTQFITDEVIEFVRANPEIGAGVRRGNVVYHTKIPYMAREYLAATDPALKRSYACHCPWARELAKASQADAAEGRAMPPVWCHCSAGFVKKPFEAILGQELEVEVLETVLSGGLQCRFAIKLPDTAR